MKQQKLLVLIPKSEMYKLPAQHVGQYAEQDASLTLRLWQQFKGLIVKEDVGSVFELETKVLRVIIDMRGKGVCVDLDRAEQVKQKLENQENNILKEIKSKSGVNVEIWAADSVAKVFDSLGLTYKKTEKTQAPSFTKNFLKNPY